MSHGPYTKDEESFLSDKKTTGWQCPRCKSIWAPSVIKCESLVCIRLQESLDKTDPREFLTE